MNANKKGIIICVAALFLLCAVLLVRGVWSGTEGDSTSVVENMAQGYGVTGGGIAGEGVSVTGEAFTVSSPAQETQTGAEKEASAGKGKKDEKENKKSGEKESSQAGDKKNPSAQERASDGKNASKSSSKAKEKKSSTPSTSEEAGEENTPTASSASPESTTEPQEENKKNECSLTVTCAEVFSHMDKLSESAARVIPADGIILQGNFEFTPGETAFDVLKRVCAEKKIHLDYVFTPLYGTYYIRGIHNLYEFDCGDESGWMYSVNGVDPGCGCSNYKLSKDDQLRFYYTCEY